MPSTLISAPHSAPWDYVNPVNGERMRALVSSAETGGALARLRFAVPPGASGPPLHVHRRIVETFTVVAGTLDLEAGPAARSVAHARLGPGETISVGSGEAHRFWNDSDAWTTFDAEVRSVVPGAAARFEAAMRAVYALAADGEADARGIPRHPVHLVLMLDGLDCHLTAVPRAVERVALGPLAWAARRSPAGKAFQRHAERAAR